MIKGNFQRNSRQREIILEELRKLSSHPTAALLYEAVRKRLPNISLGTVYRNLDLLSRKGIISKLEVAGSQARFDGDTMQHCHIRCTNCGKIDDVHNTSYNNDNISLTKIDGYDVQGYHVSFFGICPDCRGKN